MVINFNPKYIPGDIVYNHKKEIIRITSSYLKGTKLFYYRDGDYGWIREDAIKPIPLTPKILEKNGWKKEVMSRGVTNSHWVYTKPDIEEYGYFPIYIEKGIGDEFDVYPFTDNNVCTQIAYIKYVHQLQHLLFGLGINHEMEV
jgi:hypothetical protein